MPYIIDGHNLIGKLSSIDLSDPDDEHELIHLLIRFLTKNNKRGIVFFDRGTLGSNRESSLGRLEVRFVQPPYNADYAIQKYIEKIKPEGSNFIVVTSDRELQAVALQAGARWMRSEEFASLISIRNLPGATANKPDQTLSSQEIMDWERLFKSRNEDK